jgi:outer membrane protein assembly factor BamD (BamD/ComL family)
MMANKTFHRVLCCGLLCASVVCGPVQAAPKPPTYPERQVYNPATGTWTVAPSPVPGTEQGDLQMAMIDLAENRAKQAKDRLKKWLKKYPNSEQKGEAMVALGDAELALDNRMQAYRQYEKALDQYPGLESEERILRHEFAIGVAFLSGVKQKVFGIFRFPANEEALDILDKVAMRAPGAALAEDAIKAKADYYYRNGEFALAETEYARLAQEFPRGRYPRLALLMSAQSALARFPGVMYDDSALLEARERFISFRERYPEFADQENVAAFVRRIDETLAQKHLIVAKWYARQKRLEPAAIYFREVVSRWPDTAAAVDARSRLSVLSTARPLAPVPMELPTPGSMPATQTAPATQGPATTQDAAVRQG